jgi:hypothetical protein
VPATPTNDGYREVLDAFVAAMATANPRSRIPACPAWTAHELLAHQVHQLAGMCDGSFPVRAGLDALTAPSEQARAEARREQQAWIDGGVTARRTHVAEALVAEWRNLADHAPASALAGVLPDVVVHLFDLYGLTGQTTHRERPFVFEALEFWHQMANRRVSGAGYDGLLLNLADGRSLGVDGAEVVAEGSAFELLRAITGRRSRGQACSLRVVAGDPAALDHLALYGWRTTDLVEPAGHDGS